jgi:hypothetical protein
MTGNVANREMFTILYEVRDQQYLIGVTDADVPIIAALGVNTSRPLPQNIRQAVVETVMEIKKLQKPPEVFDYNAPSRRFSRTILGDFTSNPLEGIKQPVRTIEEALAELRSKMQKEAEDS